MATDDTGAPDLRDEVVVLVGTGAPGHFRVEHRGEVVGAVAVDTTDTVDTTDASGADGGTLTWSLEPGRTGHGFAARAVRLLVAHAFGDLGLTRVQARVPRRDEAAVRVATRAGLLREGVLRRETGDGGVEELVLLARLRSDPPPDDPRGFRSLLNSFLPRKRAIGQLLVRDAADRVLLCRLTYKDDWDLPGGVVEVNESPRDAVRREVKEELDLDLQAGRLLLTDWLPPWSGWDDALTLVYDGGAHEAGLLETTTLQAREIRDVEFCSREQVRERCADFTARRVEAALDVLAGGGTAYTESGRP